ncbi:MAG: S-methyl-5-thioribose-1-phosphate isomerase [Candidatus Micrarchaeia archaeon]
MQAKTKKVIADIKALKVQGARNIAKAALNSVIYEIKNSKERSSNEFVREISKTIEVLSKARPTEPMLRNVMMAMQKYAVENRRKDAKLLKSGMLVYCKRTLDEIDKNVEKLKDYGAKYIPDKATIMVHCHSSTVTGIIKKAVKMGKEVDVIACETRPRYQGRITAEELAKAGIEVTFIVDGAMNFFAKKTDFALVGADAITATGDLVNKIGTSTLAHIMRFHDKSFFSATETLKYDPLTQYGVREHIEERDPTEVWKVKMKNLKIRNPAFDVTAAKYINAYITEQGIIPPQALIGVLEKERNPQTFKI